MAEFDIVMKYKPGSAMIELDALSRKTGVAKEGLESEFFPVGTILGLDYASDRDMNSPNLDLPDPDIGIDISSWERNQEGGPCLYLHAVGPGNFWSACQMLTATGGLGEGFRYVWFPPAAAFGM